MTSVEHTYTGALRDRFVVESPAGSVVDFEALDEVVAEAIQDRLFQHYRARAAELRECAGEPEPRRVGHSLVYEGLARQFDEFADHAARWAGYHRQRGDARIPTQNRTEPEPDAVVLGEAERRLRAASGAQHEVPASLARVAGWLAVHASLTGTDTGCEWCRAGTCPAVEAARALVGDSTGSGGVA